MGSESRQRSKYCILLAGHSNPLVMEKHKDFSDMFLQLLSSPDEEWRVYSVVDGEFPTEEELHSFQGIVVTGSKHDAHGPEAWISRLCQLLKGAHERGSAKILGVCFGHQVLARALGGVSGRAPRGWEAGIRRLEVTPALSQLAYAKDLPESPYILEVHRDQVLELPPGAELLASSPKTPIEMYRVGENTLGIQGHPEFNKDVVDLILRFSLDNRRMTPEVAQDSWETLRNYEPHNDLLKDLCLRFFKGQTS